MNIVNKLFGTHSERELKRIESIVDKIESLRPAMLQLTDEQLLEKIHAGDSACMDVLIERYKRQVRNQARTLYLIGGDSDDLIQEGMLGLFKAIRDYRPERSDSFEAFAVLCISRQIYSAIQAAGRLKHAPLNSYVELSPELGESAGGLKGKSPEELLIDQENIQSLREEILKVATPLEQEILQAYLEGQSYTEIARQLQKDPKSIDNALQRIRRKLKKRYFNKNLMK